jgi:hypothetical protein
MELHMTKPKMPTGKGKAGKAKTKAAGTKLQRMEAMLRRPEGATIGQLSKALDWQAHSIRGAMSGTLKKKQGLAVTASKADGQDRVYRIEG